MKIVMEYECGDDCTFSCRNTLPIEYSSIEEASIVFEELVQQHSKDRYTDFVFCGHEFSPDTFLMTNYDHDKDKKHSSWPFSELYISPTFMTVDEWFKQGN
jgi:hypothetical protein